VGISIGASCVKVVELKKSGKTWQFSKYGSSPIQGAVSEQREIIDAGAVSRAILDAMAKAGISTKEVCASIAGSGVIIKTLTVTVADMKELNDQVLWEAEQYIPFDINDVAIDYQILRRLKDNQVEVIVVAVKNDGIEQLRNVMEISKLRMTVLDVEVFALQNCFEMNQDPPANLAVMIADIGAMSTKSIICAEGKPLFTKDSPYGGMMVNREIQRELKLATFADAESLKVSGNLPQEVADIVGRTSHTLGAELKKTIDYYNASSVGPPVSVLYLSGGASRAPGLPHVISEYVSIPVEFLNPFERVRPAGKDMNDSFLESIAAEVAVPMGLALRSKDKS
jgi:type IV pilus assembly protein PilM